MLESPDTPIGIPWLLVELFLIINVATMLVGSVLAIAKKHTEYAVGGLFIVMLSQAFGYGLAFDFNFFVRNLSILGGLLMLLADYYMSTKKKTLFAGIPSVSENDRTVYLQVIFLMRLLCLHYVLTISSSSLDAFSLSSCSSPSFSMVNSALPVHSSQSFPLLDASWSLLGSRPNGRPGS